MRSALRLVTKNLRHNIPAARHKLINASKRNMSVKIDGKTYFTPEELHQSWQRGYTDANGKRPDPGQHTEDKILEAYNRGRREASLGVAGALNGAYKEALEKGKVIGISEARVQFEKTLDQERKIAYAGGVAVGRKLAETGHVKTQPVDSQSTMSTQQASRASGGSGNNIPHDEATGDKFFTSRKFLICALGGSFAAIAWSLNAKKDKDDKKVVLEKNAHQSQVQQALQDNEIEQFMRLLPEKTVATERHPLFKGLIAIAKKNQSFDQLVLAAKQKGVASELFYVASIDHVSDYLKINSSYYDRSYELNKLNENGDYPKLIASAQRAGIVDEALMAGIKTISLLDKKKGEFTTLIRMILNYESLNAEQQKKLCIDIFDRGLFSHYFCYMPQQYLSILPATLAERDNDATLPPERLLQKQVELLSKQFNQDQMFIIIAANSNSAKAYLLLQEKNKLSEILSKAIIYYCSSSSNKGDNTANLLKAAKDCDALTNLREINNQISSREEQSYCPYKSIYLMAAHQAGILRDVIMAGTNDEGGFLSTSWIGAANRSGLLAEVVTITSELSSDHKEELSQSGIRISPRS